MATKTDIKAIAAGFLNYLDKQRARHLLPEIIKELSISNPTTEATIQSARELPPAQKKQFMSLIKEKFKIDEVKFEVDKTLLGGTKIILGDQVLDFSARAKLDYFSQSL